MKTKSYLLGLFLLATSYLAIGQDIHFTNYDFGPLSVNPAQAGSFLGSVRASGIARDQFSSFIDNPWRTGMLSVDAPLDFGFRKQDWIGVGLSLLQDQVGDVNFKTSGIQINLAYHLALDKKQTSYFTVGLQYGTFARTLDTNLFRAESDIIAGGGTSGSNDPLVSSLMLVEDNLFNQNVSDFGAGLQYTSKINKTNKLIIGAALNHFRISTNNNNGMGNMNNNPNEVQVIFPVKFTGHASYLSQLNKKVDLEYALYYARAAQVNNIMPQFRAYFNLQKVEKIDGKRVKKDKGRLMAGLGYRVDDALQFLTGYEINDWRFGVAYDLTVSSASNYNNFYGALEIGVQRIFNIYKKPEVKPAILCPKF